MIKVKDFIKQLQRLDSEQYIEVACDEEWNTIFTDFEIAQNGDFGAYIIFGLSGSEEESWADVANSDLYADFANNEAKSLIENN